MRWRDEERIRHWQGQNYQYTGFAQIFGSKLLDFFQAFPKTMVYSYRLTVIKQVINRNLKKRRSHAFCKRTVTTVQFSFCG